MQSTQNVPGMPSNPNFNSRLKGLPKRYYTPNTDEVCLQAAHNNSGQIEKGQLLEEMEGKNLSNGWDIGVFYDQSAINDLFKLQYSTNLKNKNNIFQPINWEGKNSRLSHVSLDAPFISFDACSLTNSRVTALLRVISGRAVELSTETPNAVVYMQRMNAWGDRGVAVSIPVSEAAGTVSPSGEVKLSFTKAKLESIDLTPSASPLLGAYIQSWLKENTVDYSLGSLQLSDDDESFKPTKFRVQTQPMNPDAKEGDADYGKGAVITWVLSNKNEEEGTLPVQYPYLIPKGYSGSLLLSSTLLFKDFLKPIYDKKLEEDGNVEANLALINPYSKQAAFLSATSGYKEGLPLQVEWTATGGQTKPHNEVAKRKYRYLTTYLAKEVNNVQLSRAENVRFPYAQINNPDVRYTVKATEGLIVQTWEGKSNMRFAYEEINKTNDKDEDEDTWNERCLRIIDIREGGAKYATQRKLIPSVKEDGEISFEEDTRNLDEVVDPLKQDDHIPPRGSFKYNAWGEFTKDTEKRLAFLEDMKKSLQEALGQAMNIQLPEIKTFLFKQLLFPAENILQFKAGGDDIAAPGDLILFGQVGPSKTALRITSPIQIQEGVLPINLKSAVVFKTQPQDDEPQDDEPQDDKVEWSVQGEGTIDKDGNYTPPATLANDRATSVVITAKVKDNELNTTSIAFHLTESPIDLIISIGDENSKQEGHFFILQQGDEEAVKLKVVTLNGFEKPTNTAVTILENDDGKKGSLATDGNYYIGDDDNPFPEGFTPVTFKAQYEYSTLLNNPASSYAQLCLVSPSAKWGRRFSVNPSYAEMSAGDSLSFQAEEVQTYRPAKWEVFSAFSPADGLVPQYDTNKKTWSVKYTAPNSIPRSSTVIIRVVHCSDGNNPIEDLDIYGYAVVELRAGETTTQHSLSAAFNEEANNSLLTSASVPDSTDKTVPSQFFSTASQSGMGLFNSPSSKPDPNATQESLHPGARLH